MSELASDTLSETLPRRDDRPVEVPVFSIESSDKPTDGKTPTATTNPVGRMPYIIATFAILALILFAVWMMFNLDGSREQQLSSSVTDKENLELLKKEYSPVAEGTTLSSDRALRLFENAKTNLMNNRVILMKDLI